VIGDDGLTVGFLQGDLIVNGLNIPVMENISAIPELGRIPLGVTNFVGRSKELENLRASLTLTGRAAVIAVHGLGGVGKSSIAAQFARLHADRYSLVWWVTADSKIAISMGLSDLATTLAPESAKLPLEQRIDLAVRWLATHDDWLLILDNLTIPSHVTELLDRVRTGTIIITSRHSSGWLSMRTIPLDVLTAEQALELFTRIVREEWLDAPLEDADTICTELGSLPLAIAQAGAYIAQTRVTPSVYLELLDKFPAKAFSAAAAESDAHRTMARVWHVTLDRLTEDIRAGRILRILAWYAPDNIPRQLLDKLAELPDVLSALGKLASYSMITLAPDTISVHRLVQAVTRTPDNADPHRQPEDISDAQNFAILALLDAIDEHDHRIPSSWPVYHAIEPHARALIDHSSADTDNEALFFLLNHIGTYVDSRGDTKTAISYLSRAAQGFEKQHGADHQTTLGARTNLASAYWAAGNLTVATSLLESAAADSLRAHGADNPSTMTISNNLANVYKSAGDLHRAIPLLEATVADRTRLWGADDPRTLTAQNNLANAYHDAKDFSRAAELHSSVVADRTRVLGPDAPGTLNSRHGLAHAYQSMGNLAQAMPMLESVVADRTRVLGADHPATLDSKYNLATTYRSAKDYLRAVRLHKSVYADYSRVLGPDHPSTLNSQRGLASTYMSAGNLKRAIRLLEEALADHIRALGDGHPSTISVRISLADAYNADKNFGQGIKIYEVATADCIRTFGPEHSNTLQAQGNHAVAVVQSGDHTRGIQLSESVAANAARALGKDDPITLAMRNNLAHAYLVVGQRPHAITLLKSAWTDSARALGNEHPTTAAIRKNLDAAKGRVISER
jgi:tetratricopeptide (TPR) repeat protein